MRVARLFVAALLALAPWSAHRAMAAPAPPPAAPAPADSSAVGDAREESRAAFRRGVAAAKSGDYKGARDAFVEAYKLFPHPSILLNLGIARSHVGEWVDAEQDLVRFLADDGGATSGEIDSARAALAEVKHHLGTLKVKVTPDAARLFFDGRPVAHVAGTASEIRALEGSHELRIEADGYQSETQHLDVQAGGEASEELALRALPHEAPPPSGDSSDRSRRVIGFSLVGASVVAAGIGTYAGLVAIHEANEYNSQPAPQDASLKSSGKTFRTVADVSFLVSIVAAGAGVYFLLVPGKSTSPQVVVGPGYSGLRGVF